MTDVTAQAPPPCQAQAQWSEHDRLAALARYDILDTPIEAEFDDIARLAADILEAPIAVVNFIGRDRQWFKAEVGIGAHELPMDVSICTHALLERDMLVVPDLLGDSRFVANPLVTESDGLRFYAGALLKTSEGLPIGTVCVLDRKPRPEGVTLRQRMTLEMLARQVMTQLGLRLELKRASEAAGRQQLLINELAHRMKNTLAMVQSIVSQTLRAAPSTEAARAQVMQRLAVLGRAQDVLTHTSWTAASLVEIVAAALAPLALGQDRLTVEGPDLQVGSRATLSLTLALHELATNAVKYGSLSVPEGRIVVSWNVHRYDGAEKRLSFTWKEEGGPPVRAPASTGFGSRLLKSLSRSFAGSDELSFDPAGVRWRVDADLATLRMPEHPERACAATASAISAGGAPLLAPR